MNQKDPPDTIYDYLKYPKTRSEGCKIMTLDTTEILQKAQKFYRKKGYKKTGKTTLWFGHLIYEFAKKLI